MMTQTAPLFLIPGFDSPGGAYEPLERAANPEMPIVRLERHSPALIGIQTVEGLAAYLVRAIRNEQGGGPYRLFGDAGGGIVAYEVARQLIGQNEIVDFLGIARAPHPRVASSHDPAYEPQPMPIAIHLFVETTAGQGDDLGWSACVPKEKLVVQALSTTGSAGLSEALQAAIHSSSRDVASIAVRNVEEPIVIVQSGRSARLPVLCVPGAGDHGGQFVELATALGNDWPVYALAHRGLDEGFVPSSTVEAAAEYALSNAPGDLFAHPIHLIGHSFGGWIALELALRLADSSRPVASLTIIDSDPPCGEAIPEYTAKGVLREYARAVQLLSARPIALDDEMLQTLPEEELVKALHRRMISAAILPARSQVDILAGSLQTFGAALRTSYAPSATYDAPLLLVFADDPELDASANAALHDRAFGMWNAIAPRAERRHAEGNHLTILRQPHADDFAAWWRSQIAHTIS
jgi:thioesterase domain-containing protein